MKRNKTEFKILKAFNGDCILVKTFNENFEEFIILIDGGTPSTFNFSLKRELEEISKIDILILTHIDSDHIGGLKKLFQNSIVEEIDIQNIWVNNPELISVESGELISFRQAFTLKNLILQKKPKSNISNEITTSLNEMNFDGIVFKMLSPSNEILQYLFDNWKSQSKKKKEIKSDVSSSFDVSNFSKSLIDLSKGEFCPDKSLKADIFNSSSIAFILECLDLSILFLADSRPEIIIKKLKEYGYDELKKLKVDFVKISHHGSKNNTSPELLSIIDCENFIISTNGGIGNHKHPSRETIARIVYSESRDFNKKLNIFLNYPFEDLTARIGNFINQKDLEDGNWQIKCKNEF